MATTSKKSASKKTKTTRKVSAATTRKSTTKKVAPKKKTTSASAAKTASTRKTAVVVKAQKPSATSTKTTSSVPMQKLRTLNIFVAFASFVQAALILFMSKAFGGIRTVGVSYPTNDSLATASSGTSQIVSGSHRLFDVHLAWLIAAFLIVNGLMHLIAATVIRKRYEREITSKVNRNRWTTYSVAGSLLLVTIALTAGITDLVTLLSIVGFTVLASLVSLSREHYSQNGERSRLVYGIGAIAAAGPWIIFLVNILARHQYGVGSTEKYMYWIYITGFILVLALAKNLRQQTRVVGRWTDYVYAEKVYIWLSLIGNGAIAWQIYAALLKK